MTGNLDNLTQQQRAALARLAGDENGALQERIAELEARIAELEAQLEAVRNEQQ